MHFEKGERGTIFGFENSCSFCPGELSLDGGEADSASRARKQTEILRLHRSEMGKRLTLGLEVICAFQAPQDSHSPLQAH